MRIVIAAPLYPPEIAAPAPYAAELAARLSAEHEARVVAYAKPTAIPESAGLVVVDKRRSLAARLIGFMLAIWRATDGADAIYALNTVAAGLPAVVAGFLRRKPVIVRVFEDEVWERAVRLGLTAKGRAEYLKAPQTDLRLRLIRSVHKFVLRRADMVSASSLALAKDLTISYNLQNGRVAVDYEPPEKDEVLPFPVEESPHQIFAYARSADAENLKTVIRAMPLILERFPDAMLVVAGQEHEAEKEVRESCETAGSGAGIEFLGRIPKAQAWYLRKASGVSLVSTRAEDAMEEAVRCFAARTPVVALGDNEAVDDGISGVTVVPGDHVFLAKAIIRLFSDQSWRGVLTGGGENSLSRRFSWTIHTKRLLDIVGIANGRRGGA